MRVVTAAVVGSGGNGRTEMWLWMAMSAWAQEPVVEASSRAKTPCDCVTASIKAASRQSTWTYYAELDAVSKCEKVVVGIDGVVTFHPPEPLKPIELPAGAAHIQLVNGRGPREIGLFANMPRGDAGLWLASVHPIKYGRGTWRTESLIFEDGSYILCRPTEVVRSYPIPMEGEPPDEHEDAK